MEISSTPVENQLSGATNASSTGKTTEPTGETMWLGNSENPPKNIKTSSPNGETSKNLWFFEVKSTGALLGFWFVIV